VAREESRQARQRLKIPILAYQPMHIGGTRYSENHLVALASDLRRVAARRFRIVPLRSIVDAWLAGKWEALKEPAVALTCDLGIDFVYRDIEHPKAGAQRSMLNILRDFASESGSLQPQPHLTCFAVASPEARRVLDAACMLGQGWWSDSWWRDAVASGLIHIANNSWDLNHALLPATLAPAAAPGSFESIDTEALADHEIRRACDYLRDQVPNPGTALFAYPFGEASAYLAKEYLPRQGKSLGLEAAFTASGGFFTADCDRWRIPRLSCGRDWSSPEELDAILDAALAHRESDEFAAFLRARVEPIEGWLHAEAARLTSHLVRAQHASGVFGPTLEIGVYKGKYLAVLYELSRPDEDVVGVDLFVGSEDTLKDAAAVKSNVAAACGDSLRLSMLVEDSLELTSAKLASHARGGCYRFISIDGGHTRELVRHDLAVAAPLLIDGGIIALDDAFNHSTPGVMEGIAQFFLESRPRLAPFAVCYNKLFVTTPEFHDRYLRHALAFLEQGAAGLPTQARTLQRRKENAAIGYTPTLFGYEVLPFL
jgi:hypothetical protein